MRAKDFRFKSMKDNNMMSGLSIKGGELVVPQNFVYHAHKHSSSTISLLHQKLTDIENYIAATMYYNRDLIPHDGRYYNRRKWLRKLGLWKYD